MFGRRSFLLSSASCLTALTTGDFLASNVAAGILPRKKIAFLGTVVTTHSHAQHFLDRLTQGYIWQGRWQSPRVDVASVYIEQFPEKDLARSRIARHGLRSCSSIVEALTLGGKDLAVDGVVLIAEHGDYPNNDKGQKLYPRHKWFKEVVRVFESSGRSVPVFNDKHLSTSWDECVEMVADSERLKFPFLAGSSLPVTWRLPSIEMPLGTPLSESVCVAYGGVDSYDIHALETAQCMSERRQGGEKGVRSVLAVRNQSVWDLLDQSDRQTTRDLLVAALNRSHNLPVQTGYPTEAVTYDWAKKTFPSITAYFIEHLDGFRTTMFLTSLRDFNYAGFRTDTNEIISCQMYLPMPGSSSTTADFFNPLTRHIEDMILQNRAAYPVKRTLLTSGMVIAGVESLHRGETTIETPHLTVEYSAPQESGFWRD